MQCNLLSKVFVAIYKLILIIIISFQISSYDFLRFLFINWNNVFDDEIEARFVGLPPKSQK